MSNIQTYLDEIRNALYGEEVRGSIINAINECYADAAAGVTPSFAFSEEENGTKVTVNVGGNSNSFSVKNGKKTVLHTARYVSNSVTCSANSSASTSVKITIDPFPNANCDFVAVLNAYSNGNVVNVYCNTAILESDKLVTLWWNNPFNQDRTVTFVVNVLFVEYVDEVADSTLIKNTAYPVGSVYTSTQNTDPSTLFGGTWASLGSPSGYSETIYAWKRTA